MEKTEKFAMFERVLEGIFYVGGRNESGLT